ncbi:MAG: hypothetical protein IKO74_07195 [Selenomonadaceae bacterium]|nr:hypothetical protein [Selenomonadaceae bacterium]
MPIDNDKTKEKFIEVANINGYLIPGPNIYVRHRKFPFFDVPEMFKSSAPADDGNLIIESKDYDEFIAREPHAKKYIRRLLGGREFINNLQRWCLWLKDCPPDELRKMPLVYERVKKVKEFRLKSTRAGTRKAANMPTNFLEDRQPTNNYIFIPQTSSSRRKYIPIGFLPPEIVAVQGLTIPNANLFHFGVLMSSVHMNWVRLVCGRLKSDYRYSATICYNPFPWPLFYPEEFKARIEKTAQKILDARKNYPKASYADLYDEISMPYDLRKAHEENDLAVLSLYGRLKPEMSELEMQIELLYMYEELRENFDDLDEE